MWLQAVEHIHQDLCHFFGRTFAEQMGIHLVAAVAESVVVGEIAPEESGVQI